jgi:uncharacterized membrane protein YqjE
MPPPEAPVSNLDRVRGVVQAVLRYVAARGHLFQIEAQEAGSHLAAAVIMAVIGLGALGGAWLLLVPAAVSYAARQWHQPWEYVAAGAGAAHLLIAMVLLLGLKRRLRRMKLFEESLNQFEKDRSWVAHETQPK